MLVSTVRTLFEKECPSTTVRSMTKGPSEVIPLFHGHLRDWVVLGGGNAVDLALFLVEAGAACAPGPFLSTAGMFVPLLQEAGHPLADDAAAGVATGTVAFAGDPLRWQVLDL